MNTFIEQPEEYTVKGLDMLRKEINSALWYKLTDIAKLNLLRFTRVYEQHLNKNIRASKKLRTELSLVSH